MKNKQLQEKTETNQEELKDLPQDWRLTEFKSSLSKEKYKSGKVKQQHFKKTGEFPIIDQGKKKIAGYWDKKEDVYTGSLPIVIFGDHTRIVKYIDFRFVCGADGTKIIIPNRELFDTKYFFYALSSFDIPNRGYNRHYSLLSDKKIPLPSLSEQKKIASVLSTVQNAKEISVRIINSLKELKKSTMKHLFTYGVVDADSIEKVKLRETEIGMIPEHWKIIQIREVTNKIKRGASKKTNDSKGAVYLTSDYLTDEGFLTFKNIKYLDIAEVKSLKNYIIESNDLIVNCVNSLEKIGKVAVFQDYREQVVIGFNNYALTLNRGLINPYYLKYFLLSFEGKKQIQKITNPAVKQASFASNHLLNLYFPKISLSEQEQIATILSAIDKKLEAEEQKILAFEEIFNSLLKNLMSGKIRVSNLNIEVENGRN